MNIFIGMDLKPFEVPQPEPQFKYSLIQTVIWSIIVLIGLLFLTEHWPGRVFMLTVSTGGLFGYNFCAWLLLRGRNMVNNVVMILFLIWIVVVVVGILWWDEYPITVRGLPVLGTAFVFVGALNALVYRKHFLRM